MRRGGARPRVLCRALQVLCLLGAMAGSAGAQAQLCDRAAEIAARESGVPLAVLRTLTRVETGRGRAGGVEPWPWTLNIGGDGAWFEDAAAALAAARRALADGRRNVDLGCFQINHRWHGAEFADLSEMLDPVANARYAARFLRELHAELGDWTAAAGAFHSRNPVHAERYLARYREIAALPLAPDGGEAPEGPARPEISRTGPRAPTALVLSARPPLWGAGRPGTFVAARPIRAEPARPLWEMP